MVTVRLDMKKDCFFAEFSNLGVGNVPIADEYPEKFDRLLCGGIWCIVQLDYEVEGDNNFGIEDIDGNPLRSKQKKQKDIFPTFVSWNRKALVSPRINTKQKNRISPIKKP